MASYTTTFAQRFRKAISAVGIGIAPTATTAVSSIPQVTAGSGAPSATLPNGSLYLRTDATDGDDALYARIGGAWVVIYGKTA